MSSKSFNAMVDAAVTRACANHSVNGEPRPESDRLRDETDALNLRIDNIQTLTRALWYAVQSPDDIDGLYVQNLVHLLTEQCDAAEAERKRDAI